MKKQKNVIPFEEMFLERNEKMFNEKNENQRERIERPSHVGPITLTVIIHDFVKQNANEYADQLDQFSNSLNKEDGSATELAIKYRYSDAQRLEAKNDANYVRFWTTKHGAGIDYSKAWTEKGEEIRHGKGITITAFPVGADVSSPPTAVLPGTDTRFREKAKWAKGQTNIYGPGDGITMAIEVISSPFVPADGKPVLKITVSTGGHPKIEYPKSKYQGINLYKNSGDGKWAFLVTCNDPSCVDLSTMTGLGLSAAWGYKAMYLFGGKEVGYISLETFISVLGVL
jgi:hypothetical protein